MKNGSTMVILA